jgi:hypothetical protein
MRTTAPASAITDDLDVADGVATTVRSGEH